jgi:hypothetical protein
MHEILDFLIRSNGYDAAVLHSYCLGYRRTFNSRPYHSTNHDEIRHISLRNYKSDKRVQRAKKLE